MTPKPIKNPSKIHQKINQKNYLILNGCLIDFELQNLTNVAPRTLQTPSGGSSVAKCPNGDDTSFRNLDVRIKQGTIKPNTTPAGDRQAEKEVKLVHAGVVATCDTPYPLEMGVMCLPLCHQ